MTSNDKFAIYVLLAWDEAVVDQKVQVYLGQANNGIYDRWAVNGKHHVNEISVALQNGEGTLGHVALSYLFAQNGYKWEKVAVFGLISVHEEDFLWDVECFLLDEYSKDGYGRKNELNCISRGYNDLRGSKKNWDQNLPSIQQLFQF